ncbi:MAG: sulfatase-like hydrolase/transferase [Candidatus Angelobacter sp.]
MSSIKVSPKRWLSNLDHAGETAFALVLFLSSLYCLLAYIPTTYFSFIQAPFLSWMPVFARLQPYLFAITFCASAIPLRNRMRISQTRGLVLEFCLLGILGGMYLIWARPVQLLRNNSLSFVWAIAFLLPIISLGAVHYATYLRQLTPKADKPRYVSYPRVVLAALLISVLYPGATYLRFYIAGMPTSLTKMDLAVWLWAVITQVLLFLFVFSLAEFSLRLTSNSANPAPTRFLIYTVLCWAGLAISFFKVVLASIPFEGTDATIYACLFSLALVSFAGGWTIQHRIHRNEMFTPPAQGLRQRRQKRFEFPVILLVILASAITVPSFIGAMDWHSVLEKIWAMAFWGITAALIVWRYPRETRGRRLWPFLLTAALSLAAFRLGLYSEKGWARILSERDLEVGTALRQHASFDASFAAASVIMTPAGAIPCNEQGQFILHQPNIPATASVDLHDVNLVQNLQSNPGRKPNIFVIVVDSLRRDYLSAYNPEVTFTPSIGAFAADSVTFRNAFTRYGGTTLSEPSIWSGLLQLHKHYVQPFHRVNNLEKLVQADGYQSLVSVDTVLRILLQPAPDLMPLDTNIDKWTDLDFCSTATEAGDKIMRVRGRDKPIFLYTQPQNIHLVTLQHTVTLRPPRKQYGHFVDYYASELERLDGCFGNFIQTLKTQGLYENSIIILTSDHGEDLQKVGAERHAFSLKPEVIRIPLIVHVPPEIKKSWYYDPDWISFNTDIAATLYELAGHGPVIARPEFGRPLFTRTDTEMEKYRQGSYMIASSYGFLYGLLYDNGKKLFTESEEADQFFDLDHDPEATHNVITKEIRRRSEAQLRTDIQQIADLYGYKYTSPTILNWLAK